jgi:carbonic anhydrase
VIVDLSRGDVFAELVAIMPTIQRIVMASVVVVLSIAPAIVRGQHAEFAYSGDHGPTHWSETPGWETCAGTAADAHQSPIDIVQVTIDKTLTPLQVRAQPTPVALVNNGHTVEEEYAPGSAVAVGGVSFELAQFHFHSPAEHTLHGRHDSLELHAVFAEPRSSRKVVIAQLYSIGSRSPFLARLLAERLPAKAGEHVETSRRINVADAFVSLARYYTYDGSLTTPPCSESVTWFVLEREAHLSEEQASAFHAVLGDNARPVQGLNHRSVRATPSS